MRITNLRHPEYNRSIDDYLKWRLTYQGGQNFIEQYLVKYSKREGDTEFAERKSISYAPSFAKVAINKLKNTLYSRMSEIVRKGGPKSYISATRGEGGGVDLYGSSMDRFIGEIVLPELMTMRTIGVYVDKPPLNGPLLLNNQNRAPYLYTYPVEDILSWSYTYYEGEYVYLSALLRDHDYDYDQETGLVKGKMEKYRHIWLAADGVHVQFYLPNPNENEDHDIKLGEEVILPLKRLPFVLMGLKESLLADAADYQIGLLNLASSDMTYVQKANFPFYTEQYDPATDSYYIRRPNFAANVDHTTGRDPAEGTFVEGNKSGKDEINVGSLTGRRYPKGLERPAFVAPPTEPLLASMKKQEAMKNEIFELIDIAASNAAPQHASAESKSMDDRGLESGLSYIGLELEWGEREIAKIWALYENSEPATVKYPERYSTKTDKQRLEEAKQLDDVKTSAPSRTFAKEVAKQISRIMLSDKVSNDTLDKIEEEIEKAEYISADPELIRTAAELGMVDAVTGSNALGFNGEEVVPQAQKEHAERLARISAAQSKPESAARGNPDLTTPDDDSADEEKEKSQKTPDLKDNPADPKTRGSEK